MVRGPHQRYHVVVIVLLELMALAFLAGAAWLAYLIGPRFVGLPYEYQVLFGAMFMSQIAGAVLCHRAARRRR